MSIRMKLIRAMVKRMSGDMFSAGEINVEVLRSRLAKAYKDTHVAKGVRIERGRRGDIDVSIAVPLNAVSGGMIFYIHGGGLITGDRDTACPYASELALATGYRVMSCTYRLAPEHRFPAAIEDCLAVYKTLLADGLNVALIGESGGAYLSLALSIKLRDEGLKLPAAIVLNSVVADMSGRIKRTDSPQEITLSNAGLNSLATMYALPHELTNPLVSPILADYTGLPPMRIIYDEGELLAADSLMVAEKARAAGVYVETQKYSGCFHAFTTTGNGTPESKKELAASAAFMVKRLKGTIP